MPAAADAVGIHRRCAEEEQSCYSAVAIARLHELGHGAPRDRVEAYRWYARGALLQKHPYALAGLRRLSKTLKSADLAAAQAEVLGVKLKAALGAPAFETRLAKLSRPVVHLAGAWGFPDFKWDRPSYGRYAAFEGEPFKKGYRMLKAIRSEVEAMGYFGANPWAIDVPELFIDGVMFGAGPGADGRPWSEGSLAAKTMSRERLLHWLEVLAADFRVDPKAYARPRAASFSELEELYRGMVLDVIYQANCHNVESCDVILAELNAYRGGDADDGTVFEVILALERGKDAAIVVDESPEPTLNEGIFGRRNRWNVMLSGYLRQKKARVFHRMEEALAFLRERLA